MRAYRLTGLSHRAFAHRALAAALVGAVLVAAPASARDGRNGALIGGAAAGLLGGVALGAALASPPPPPPPAYGPRRVYVEEEPVYVRPRPPGPVCHYERRKVWLDEVDFTYRRVEVCE